MDELTLDDVMLVRNTIFIENSALDGAAILASQTSSLIVDK